MNRKDFPFLEKYVFLDSGGGALKPRQVVEAVSDFYLNNPINTHSADSPIGQKVIKDVNNARNLVAELIGASSDEIIFTSGTTDSLNKISQMFKTFLKKDDEILLSIFNHTSNVVVWQTVAEQTGAKIVFSQNLIEDITPKTKIVSYAQVNNTINKNIDITRLYKETKKVGAVLVNDAAQAILHGDVSLHDSDVVVFSGNKLYGPTGVGVLAVRKELLSFLKPVTFGGGAIADMTKEGFTVRDCNQKFEPGTLNLAGIIGLGRAVEYYNTISHEEEIKVAEYAFDELTALGNMTIFSRRGDRNIIFNVNGVNAQDVVSFMANKNIIIKAGHHCAKLISEITNCNTTIRVSLAAYNNKEDIDKLISVLKKEDSFIDFL